MLSNTYTFTVTKDFTILALYAYKDDIVELIPERQENRIKLQEGDFLNAGNPLYYFKNLKMFYKNS